MKRNWFKSNEAIFTFVSMVAAVIGVGFLFWSEVDPFQSAGGQLTVPLQTEDCESYTIQDMRNANIEGRTLQEGGRHNEAIEWFEIYVGSAECLFGPNSVEYALALNNISGSWKQVGREEQAIAGYRTGLEIVENLHSTEHPHYQDILHNLKGLLIGLGRSEDALALR